MRLHMITELNNNAYLCVVAPYHKLTLFGCGTHEPCRNRDLALFTRYSTIVLCDHSGR